MAETTPEQQKELQERLKSMSPEEILEFQKQNCIFCRIVEGKIPSKKVYEDEKCIVILDINPANPGHLLILPKQHYAVMPQMPEEILQHCFIIAKHLSQALLQALNVQGTNILVQNGPAAGQRANHFMVHLIPRKEDDGLNLSLPEQDVNEANVAKLKSALKPVIAKTFGLEEVEEPEKKSQETTGEKSEKKEPTEEKNEEAQEPAEDIDVDTLAKLLSK